MKRELKLSFADEKYKPGINNMIDVIIPEIQKFYSDFGVELDMVVYDTKSSLVMSFISNSQKSFVSIDIFFSRLETVATLLLPWQRTFKGSFELKNASPELVEVHKKNKDAFKTVIETAYESKNNAPIDKVNELLTNIKPTVDNWKGIIEMQSIFLF
jgi:hypothetical protein